MSAPFYEPGLYECIVTDHAYQESKNGYPMIVFKVTPAFVVVSQFDAAGERVENRYSVQAQWSRTVRLVINAENEDSLTYALMKLRYAGFEGSRFEDMNLLQQRVRCQCKHESYEGKIGEKWDLALPPREDKPLEKKGGVDKKLNALFGKKLKEPTEIKPPAPAPIIEGEPDQEQPAAAAVVWGTPYTPPSEDDDIPF